MYVRAKFGSFAAMTQLRVSELVATGLCWWIISCSDRALCSLLHSLRFSDFPLEKSRVWCNRRAHVRKLWKSLWTRSYLLPLSWICLCWLLGPTATKSLVPSARCAAYPGLMLWWLQYRRQTEILTTLLHSAYPLTQWVGHPFYAGSCSSVCSCFLAWFHYQIEEQVEWTIWHPWCRPDL